MRQTNILLPYPFKPYTNIYIQNDRFHVDVSGNSQCCSPKMLTLGGQGGMNRQKIFDFQHLGDVIKC